MSLLSEEKLRSAVAEVMGTVRYTRNRVLTSLNMDMPKEDIFIKLQIVEI